jgi:IS30 family transposase
VVERILKLQWSPEQIEQRLDFENNPRRLSSTTIYRGITKDNLGVPRKSHSDQRIACQLRHHGKTRQVKGMINKRRGQFHCFPSIIERPIEHVLAIGGRYGTWQVDIAGMVLVDRRSRFLLASSVSSERYKRSARPFVHCSEKLTPHPHLVEVKRLLAMLKSQKNLAFWFIFLIRTHRINVEPMKIQMG